MSQPDIAMFAKQCGLSMEELAVAAWLSELEDAGITADQFQPESP